MADKIFYFQQVHGKHEKMVLWQSERLELAVLWSRGVGKLLISVISQMTKQEFDQTAREIVTDTYGKRPDEFFLL